jgi:hypothetical protein
MHDDAAIKTYRYLRIGIVGVVLLLGVSVMVERSKMDCWQTSISAYYYTPVRAIFVGGLMAIGLCLIVIKGSTVWEDSLLNVAGMLAPVVALAPTSDVGNCWSIQVSPLPKFDDGQLAPWVTANIDNNITALVVAGIVGLVVAAIIAMIATRDLFAVAQVGDAGMRRGLLAALVLLLLGGALFLAWDDFDTRAHGYAAILMFVALAGAVVANAVEHRQKGNGMWFRWYSVIAVAMVVGGLALGFLGGDWRHRVLVLEMTEIALFAAFWLVQTAEHWGETAGSPAA